MPKPLLRQTQENNLFEAKLKTTGSHKQKVQQIDKLKLDRMLRKPRSKQYMDALFQLDAGGHTMNQDKVNEIIDTIRNEFPEVEINDILIGFVSICNLGAPYEVHTLNMMGEIIKHFKRGECLTNGMEKARSIAMHGGYAYIEVYVDCCRAISSNGTVSVIEC